MWAIVSGDVQGSGYRAFVRRHAEEIGIGGRAENLPDGRVEVIAEGIEDELRMLLQRMQKGPTHAKVETIQVEWADAGPPGTRMHEFEIVY